MYRCVHLKVCNTRCNFLRVINNCVYKNACVSKKSNREDNNDILYSIITALSFVCPLDLWWVESKAMREEFQMLEFFAGRANLSRCMRASGIKTASFDVLYKLGNNNPEKPYKSNAMDINDTSGFAPIVKQFVEMFISGEGPPQLHTYHINCI